MDEAPNFEKIHGSLLVFGGPYSNLEATKAILKEASRLEFVPGNIVCTGDLAAYCADPQEVTDLLRHSGIRIVMGNCEESLAAASPECGCGFAEGSACAALSAHWYAYADRNIDADSRHWMASLPRRLRLEIGGHRFLVVHGGVANINRFIFASCHQTIEEELAACGCDGVIAGHCGLPFTHESDGLLWHNAGVIGMPANDATARVWFSVLTPINDGIRIEHRVLDYDHATAAAKMRQHGLPEGYAAALEIGLWPSCDVLTPAELPKGGRCLTPGAVVWRAPGMSPARTEALWPILST